ncbi:MAG: hypothetical protein ACRD63_13825, partial [Pyrinomonadaceae bacterium]
MKQLAWLTLLFAAVLLSASFAGYKFSSRVTDPERARYLQSYILSNLQQAKDWDQVRRRAEFWRVLKNNLKVDLVIFGGALTLGFLGFSTLIINGYQ